jgi:hypothetical protein
VVAAVALFSLAASPAGLRAQDAEVGSVGGITVIGYASRAPPAETAVIQIAASEQEFGAPRAPDPDAVPGEAEREAIGPVVDALVAAGVAEDDIRVVVSVVAGFYYGPGGPGVTRVDISLDDPTPEWIDELLSAAVVGAARRTWSSRRSASATASRTAPRWSARLGGLRSRTPGRAGSPADLLGVELGAPVSTVDTPVSYSEAYSAYYGIFSPTGVSCSPPAPVPTSGAPVSAPPYDPTDEAEVNVYAQMAVTYAYEGTPVGGRPRGGGDPVRVGGPLTGSRASRGRSRRGVLAAADLGRAPCRTSTTPGRPPRGSSRPSGRRRATGGAA